MKQENILKIAMTFLFVVVSTLSFSQITIYTLDFESSGGYTTSVTENISETTDYFGRIQGGVDSPNPTFTNLQGSYYFGAQDIDGIGSAPTLPVTLNINDINVAGYTSLQLRVYLAEDDDGTNQDWDAADFVHFSVDIDDSGTFVDVLNIEATGSSGTNFAPAIDTNFDGVGNGTEITDVFTQFTSNISGTGSLIDVQISFSLDSGDEDIAIDHIEIIGTLATSDPIIGFDNATSSETETDASFEVLVPVTVSNYGSDQIDLSVAVTGGTAEVADYTLNTTSLSFSADGSKNISININPDSDDFEDETIILTITETSAVSGLTIQSTHTITVTEDETPPSIGFDAATSAETETNATFTSANIPITVTNYSGTQIDINVSVTGGTAEAGDYTFTSPTALSFTADGTQNITLDINDDADTDNETIIFTITETSAVTGLTISEATHTLTITDDEAPAGPLYSADFSNDGDGFSDHTSSTPPADGPASVGPFGIAPNQWSLSYETAPGTDGSENSFKVVSGVLKSSDWGGQGIFQSQSIDVSGINSVDVSALSVNAGGANDDTFRYFYILDGGSRVETADIASSSNDNINYTITGLDVSASSTLIVGFEFSENGGGQGYETSSFTVTDSSPALTTVTWDGSDSTDWATAANWDTNTVPTAYDNVIIPDVTNAPVISSSTSATSNNLTITEPDGVTINSGGTLIVNGTSSGNVTYNSSLATTNWYSVSSPVSGAMYNTTWVDDNNIDTTNGTGTNIGISTYTTSNDSFSYVQSGDSGSFDTGKGYSVKQDATGTLSFTGTINTSDVPASVVTGGNGGFNLIGNPFTSHLNSASFLTDNTSDLVSETIWVWNQATGVYETKITGDNFILAPTQGFFVSANKSTDLNIAESYQTTTGGTFQKSAKTEVKLMMTDGNKDRFAKIYYSANATLGFDNGYDGETFGGISNSFDVFTQLLSNDAGKKYQVQSLPNSDYENMVVPIGLIADANKEISFSAKALNLRAGIKVFLEDRQANTLVRLDEANSEYRITLTEKVDGIGRFYLHTKSSAVLSTETVSLENISIYKSDDSTLRVTGLSQGKTSVKIFNILGKQILYTSFTSNGVQDITLPKVSTGVYIVELTTENGSLNKKITLE